MPAVKKVPVKNTKSTQTKTKLFVLDTNVLMHDPSSLLRFQEHDLFIPIFVLEEMDNHKKGMSEVSRNARQASRTLDEIVKDHDAPLEEGFPLALRSNNAATGRLFLQTQSLQAALPASLAGGKADNQILAVCMALADQQKRPVILVSKDINMRIKARALGLAAEDYFNDKVLEDSDVLYAGKSTLPADFWMSHGKKLESWQEKGISFYRVAGPLVSTWLVNELLMISDPAKPANALQLRVVSIDGKSAVLRSLTDHTHEKHSVWGIVARNPEQNFALNLLMDPEIELVTLLGQAGTGKTLLALAAGLAQTLDEKRYGEIIMTRVTVPVGEDIGFLPGTEEEKMGPWMGALEDNLEVLTAPSPEAGEWGRAATNDLVRNRVKIKSLNFMRGRTFVRKFLIIDEAQNLTAKQMKTLITRAGPGSKVICLGNLAQIDTPYLTEGSSGLTHVVDRFKGWPNSGHITLMRGERSRLADRASEIL
jgi:PhoH-like ATPase